MEQIHCAQDSHRVRLQWPILILSILTTFTLLLCLSLFVSAIRPAEVASAQRASTSTSWSVEAGAPYTVALIVVPPTPWITETARVTATVTDETGQLLSGQVITFSSGGPPGTGFFGTVIFEGPVVGTTDENGRVGVTISSPTPGDRVIYATASNSVTGMAHVRFRALTRLYLPLVLKNYPPLLVGFSSNSYNVGESAGAATIVVTLSTPSLAPVTVDYAAGDAPAQADVVAVAGSDYVPVSGTLTFAPGEALKTFKVPIIQNALDESNKAVALTLGNPINARLAASGQATLNIVKGTMASSVTVQFGAAAYSVQENAGMAVITVTLSASSTEAVSVDYITQNGAASAWSDYMPEYGTLTFAPSETVKVFNVMIINDAAFEPAEALTLTLGNPLNATLGTPDAATLTIVDDESAAPPPSTSVTAQFSAAVYSVSENAGTAIITVRLNAPSVLAVTVDYAVADGTTKAWSDYIPTFGTLTFAPGETVKTFDVTILNDALLESNETIALMLGNPVNTSLGTPNVATLTILDDESALPPSAVTVQFSAATYSVSENAGAAIINVTLSAASSQIVMVSYASANGTATAPDDYTSVGGVLTFAPGETLKTATVPIVNDTLTETNETVLLTLSGPVNATLGTPNSATLTIVDDETTPTAATVQFSAATYSVNENAGAAVINVTLSAASSQVVTVSYAAGNGSAMAPGDYTSVSGMLTFAPGETVKTFGVPIVNDTLAESNETVLLALSNPVNATLGAPNVALLTIADDETTPTGVTVQFSAATFNASENAGTATIVVTLSAVSGQVVMVSYASANGTATAPGDYTAISGMLTFAPGETSRTFSVPIVNDTEIEPNETVLLSLSNPVNSTLGATYTATLTIVDDDTCAPQVLYTIPSNYSPRGMAYDPSRDRLFVANRDGPGSGSLSVINASTGQLIQSVPYLPSAHGAAFDAGRNRIYVVGGSSLFVVDGTTYVSRTIPLSGLYAQAVAYNPAADKIYVGFRDSPAVTIVSAATWQVITTLSGESIFHHVASIGVNPITNKVYVSNKKIGGWVTVIDGQTDQIITTIDTTGDLFGLAVDSVHNRVYVASIGASRVYAIDGATDQLIGDIQIVRSVDNRPVPLRHVAVNPNLGSIVHLWLTSGSDDGTWGMDRLIVLGGNWPDMGQPRAVEVPSGSEGGMMYEPTLWYVFTARAASNQVMVSRDGASLCSTPLHMNAAEEADGLYTVTHDYRHRHLPSRKL